MKKLRSKFPKTGENSPLESPAWVYPYIRNYLYFMQFVETASELTLRSYKGDLKQAFGSFFEAGDSPAPPAEKLPPLSPSREQELLDLSRMAQRSWSELSPASRNRKAATLKSLMGWLHREGLVSRDLAALVHGPKVPSRLPKHLSVDEAVALLRSCERSQSDSEEAFSTFVMVTLLYGGGLRVSEACSLKFQDIDFSQRTCRVLGKGAKERIIALPDLALNVLLKAKNQAQHKAEPQVYVFGTRELSPRTAYEWVRKAGAAAGLLRPLHPHALRHSYATHLLRSGANLRVLQALLGHASLQATSRYTHIGIDQLARTLEAHHPFGEDSKE